MIRDPKYSCGRQSCLIPRHDRMCMSLAIVRMEKSMRALLLSAVLAVSFACGALAQTPAVTATCRDGSTWTGASRRGACSGHQGVQAFGSATSTPAVAPAATPPAPATTSSMPAPVANSPAPATIAGGPGQVWVNTRSKVYHCSGDRYFGKTVQGQYMTEAAAKAAGDRPSRGKACS